MGMIDAILLILIVIIAMGITTQTLNPILNSVTGTNNLEEAENLLKKLDTHIQEATSGGRETARLLSFITNNRNFQVISSENAVQFFTPLHTQVFEYNTRKKEGNLVKYSGGNVHCYKDQNLIAENNFLRIEFGDITGEINTSKNIIRIKNKKIHKTLDIKDSSILINNDPTTSTGNGYSRIINPGKSKPLCTVKFHVNATTTYDILYTLYTGADYLHIEVVRP